MISVRVDQDLCVGTGLCEVTCPDVFVVDVTSRALLPEPPPGLHEAVVLAAEHCPTEAIIIDD